MAMCGDWSQYNAIITFAQYPTRSPGEAPPPGRLYTFGYGFSHRASSSISSSVAGFGATVFGKGLAWSKIWPPSLLNLANRFVVSPPLASAGWQVLGLQLGQRVDHHAPQDFLHRQTELFGQCLYLVRLVFVEPDKKRS